MTSHDLGKYSNPDGIETSAPYHSLDDTVAAPAVCRTVGLKCASCVRKTAENVARLCPGLRADGVRAIFAQIYPSPHCGSMESAFVQIYLEITGGRTAMEDFREQQSHLVDIEPSGKSCDLECEDLTDCEKLEIPVRRPVRSAVRLRVRAMRRPRLETPHSPARVFVRRGMVQNVLRAS